MIVGEKFSGRGIVPPLRSGRVNRIRDYIIGYFLFPDNLPRPAVGNIGGVSRNILMNTEDKEDNLALCSMHPGSPEVNVLNPAGLRTTPVVGQYQRMTGINIPANRIRQLRKMHFVAVYFNPVTHSGRGKE